MVSTHKERGQTLESATAAVNAGPGGVLQSSFVLSPAWRKAAHKCASVLESIGHLCPRK